LRRHFNGTLQTYVETHVGGETSHYTHNHWTTAKAFSSEEYFTLYWKEIGIRVGCDFGPDLL